MPHKKVTLTTYYNFFYTLGIHNFIFIELCCFKNVFKLSLFGYSQIYYKLFYNYNGTRVLSWKQS